MQPPFAYLFVPSSTMCPASNCPMRNCTFSRTSCCAVVGFRFSLAGAGLLAMLLAAPLLAVDALLLLWLMLL